MNEFDIQHLLLSAPPLLLALTLHELAHGYVAYRLGDPTAKNEGRLTMNPLKHIDPLGVLAFVFIKIGWAKPVPVDPRYFRDPLQGMLLVALAGPGMNLALAVASALLLKLLLFATILPRFLLEPLALMTSISVWINVMLAIFNLLPIPPLDGSRILMGLLPPRGAMAYAQFERYGFIIVLLLFFTGIIGKIILPIIGALTTFLVGF